jgi:hypothetical protein
MLQYAREKTTRWSLVPPHTMHRPDSGAKSRGMQQIVAFVSAFTRASHTASPHQWASDHDPQVARFVLPR